MNKPIPLPLQKPHRRSSDLVELYEDESTSTAAEPDTSVVKMLNDVMPKADIPRTNFALFDFGNMLNRAVMGASVVGHAVGNAVNSVSNTVQSSGSGTYSSGSSGYNPNAG